MKTFREKMSVTKLVFLLLTLVLGFQTVYLTLNWIETSLFNNAMLVVISFYFSQKWLKYNNVDSLIKEEEKEEEKTDVIWFNLETPEEDE